MLELNKKQYLNSKNKDIDNIGIGLIKYIYNLQILIKFKILNIKDTYNRLLIRGKSKNKVNTY